MTLRSIALLAVLLLTTLFVALNWGAIMTPTTLSLGVASIEAPLGLIMLGLLLLVSSAFLLFILYLQTGVLLETRRQIHLIKDALGKLAKDFGLFDQRMKKLADHIRLAHDDVQAVHISSRKISGHFEKIEKVELDEVTRLLTDDAAADANVDAS